MENNYWRDNKPIIASYKEKENLLQYEIWMFRETCKRIIDSKQKTKFEQNLLVESLATHTRILVDFFYGNKKYPTDLVAQDLLPKGIDWKTIRPSKTKILEEAKNKADKQLAHLSLWRIKLERNGKKGWFLLKISKDMENIIEEFEKQGRKIN